MTAHSCFSAYLAILFCTLFLTDLVEAGRRFDICLEKLKAIKNGTINDTIGFDWEYHGPIRGFDQNAGFPRPITLTYDGCKGLCGGNVPDPHDAFTAFSILTTWVLPSIAIFSNLPYEALSRRKKTKTLEAFTSWVGSPQTSLVNTFFNIYIIRRCRLLSEKRGIMEEHFKNAFYVLSCINQYEFPSYQVGQYIGATYLSTQMDVKKFMDQRDNALVYGILKPLCTDRAGMPSDDRNVIYARVLLSHLAFQLRCNRRRGVYPVLINVVWFIVAFAFSLVTAFANLGDNTTAHSLALGIFLSWLPVLVCATVIDRNPTAATRCRILIERWLYNVELILESDRNTQRILESNQKTGPILESDQNTEPILQSDQNSGPISQSDQNTEPILQFDQDTEPAWWQPEAQTLLTVSDFVGQTLLTIGGFVGQGRRLRYCGVASALLHCVENGEYRTGTNFLEYHERQSKRFRETLTTRPHSWWMIWVASYVFVNLQIFLAFVIAFNTPTVGLGCRSFLYLLFFLITQVTAAVQVAYQEPPPWMRRVTIFFNILATLLLLAIMMLQVTNGLNNCYCKTNSIGTAGFGGYTDLQNAQFYKDAFHVVRIWGTAAAIGSSSCLLAIGWSLRMWTKSSALWAVNEDPRHPPELDWRVNMIWLV